MYLDELWNYYKEQIQESNFIKELTDIDLWEDENDSVEGKNGNIIQPDFGTVTESGRGRLEHDIYIDGYYIQEENRRRKDIEKRNRN